MDLTLGFVLLFTFTFVLAGLVKGVAGMGLPTVAVGVLSITMSPTEAAALLVIPSLVTNVWQLLTGPSIRTLLTRLWSMMLGILVGTIASAALLAQVDPRWSGTALGIALIVYAVYAMRSHAISVPPRWERPLSPVIGLTTGAITGVTGVFTLPAVPWLQALRLPRDLLVQALGLAFTTSTVALAIGLGGQGAFRLNEIGWSTAAIVPALAGMALGQAVRHRISQQRFRQYFLGFLILLGLELALTSAL